MQNRPRLVLVIVLARRGGGQHGRSQCAVLAGEIVAQGRTRERVPTVVARQCDDAVAKSAETESLVEREVDTRRGVDVRVGLSEDREPGDVECRGE